MDSGSAQERATLCKAAAFVEPEPALKGLKAIALMRKAAMCVNRMKTLPVNRENNRSRSRSFALSARQSVSSGVEMKTLPMHWLKILEERRWPPMEGIRKGYEFIEVVAVEIRSGDTALARPAAERFGA